MSPSKNGGLFDDLGVVNMLLVILPFIVISMYVSLKEDMGLPVIIVCACVGIGLLIMIAAGKSSGGNNLNINNGNGIGDGNTDDQAADIKRQINIDKDTNAEVILAKLKLCQSLEENLEPLLMSLLQKCRKNKNIAFVNTCILAGVHKFVLDCVSEVSATKESAMFALCGDLLVALLKKNDVFHPIDVAASPVGSSLTGDGAGLRISVSKLELREFVDGVVMLLLNQLRKIKQLQAAMGGSHSVAPDVTSSSSSAAASVTSERGNPRSYEDQAYKFIMLIGFVGEDNLVGQNLIGDRGGITVVLEYLNYFRSNKTYVKWCSWALIHCTYAHPPNKVEFVHADGVNSVIAALRVHSEYLVREVYSASRVDNDTGTVEVDTTEPDTFYQAIALLYNVLLPDSQAKMNLAQVRQGALHSGLVDLSQGIQRRYKNNENLSNMITFLLTILMQDHS